MTIQIAKSSQQSHFFSLHGSSLVRHVNSLRASSSGRSGGWAAKRRRACSFVSGKWISRCEMLIGGDDISNDAITLGTCFQCLFTIALVSASSWLAEIWQLSRRGATGELEVEFKFQRRSGKLSFFSRQPPERPGEFARRLSCKCGVTQKLSVRNLSVLYHKGRTFSQWKFFWILVFSGSNNSWK